MSEFHVRATFYGRTEFVDFRCTEAEYNHFQRCATRLAAGNKDIPSHFLLSVDDDLKALVTIKEIQALYFLDVAANHESMQVVDGRSLLDIKGVSLFLKDRTDPITIPMSDRGPLYDMVGSLTQIDYTEEGIECVMLSDDDNCSIFFVLDEVQYALISAELLQPE